MRCFLCGRFHCHMQLSSRATLATKSSILDSPKEYLNAVATLSDESDVGDILPRFQRYVTRGSVSFSSCDLYGVGRIYLWPFQRIV